MTDSAHQRATHLADEPRRMRALDGLRGLAILSVIAVHVNVELTGPFARGGLSGLLAAVFGAGWVGVDLFFVLSGFLITGILVEAKGSAGYLRNFYARRILRIMPLYYGYLALIVLVGHFRPHTLGIQPLNRGDTLALAGYYYNFWEALVTFTPASQADHFWSLAVEEHFYLVWPLLVLLCSRRSLVQICIGGALFSLGCRCVLVLGGAWLHIVYVVTPCRLDALLAGSFLALAIRDEGMVQRIRQHARPVALGTGGLLLGLFLGQRHFVDFADLRYVYGPAVDSSLVVTIGLFALAVCFAAILALIIESQGVVRSTLETPCLVSVGKYSYAMYVFHQLCLAAVVGVADHFVGSFAALPDYVGKTLLWMLVSLVSYGVAFASFHLFERHFLHLKRHFSYRKS